MRMKDTRKSHTKKLKKKKTWNHNEGKGKIRNSVMWTSIEQMCRKIYSCYVNGFSPSDAFHGWQSFIFITCFLFLISIHNLLHVKAFVKPVKINENTHEIFGNFQNKHRMWAVPIESHWVISTCRVCKCLLILLAVPESNPWNVFFFACTHRLPVWLD